MAIRDDKKSLLLKIPEDLHSRLKVISALSKKTMSDICIPVVKKEVDRLEKLKKRRNQSK